MTNTKLANDKSNNRRGSYGGREVALYTLCNDQLEVGITDLGACVDYLRFRDGNGAMRDVCLRFGTAQQRVDSKTYNGAVIGRVANRIAGGEIMLNGKRYQLSANEGNNTLHGGVVGFDKRFFAVDCAKDSLVMQLVSEDGDQGFPAQITLTVCYKLVQNSLLVEFTATNNSDVDTVWAPTLHTYFNFDDSRDVSDTYLQINADSYTPVDAQSIPTGAVASVAGTPFDFTKPKRIGQDINAQHPQLLLTNGYDHNFVLKGEHAATARFGGIQMDLYTDLPGLQFYSGNYIQVTDNFRPYRARDGFALEPQYFPNSANDARFEQPLLKAFECKKHYIKYTFSHA